MPPPSNRKAAEVANKAQNEYIPSFISKKPFYVTDDATDASASASDYLEHQRLQKSEQDALLSKQNWYDRGRKLGPAATKFRKGACENCGAMTHKTKECLSRPRKQGAKWTGRDIEADEDVQDVQLGWDAKRDRWNGYDAIEYENVVEDYNVLEELKRNMKGANDGSGQTATGETDDVDEAKYEEETDMGRQQSTSTRNLRIREDTAKYLLNLDLDSAKYDPKTRSMVDSGATADQAAALVAEEGFMRASGEAAEFEKAQKYAWEQHERGDKSRIHLQANPTSGEYYLKKEQQEAAQKKEAHRKALLDKYGGVEHLHNKAVGGAVVTESERYVEYDDQGLIKGAPRPKAKSQYTEDELNNNHTAVWGSWWKDFQWGYACCHSTVKNSYCTGEDGKRILEEASKLDVEGEAEEVPKEIAWEEEAAEQEHMPNAIDNAEKAKLDSNARKRTLAKRKDDELDEEMEAFRKRRIAADDPMFHYLGKDGLVH